MEHAPIDIRIRRAVPADVPLLKELIAASVRQLQANDYTPEQLEGALDSVVGVDSQLIDDGTYLLAEARVARPAILAATTAVEENSVLNWDLAGCGGWSKRKTLFGSDHWTQREDTLLDPAKDAAKIRAFFVHPRWARRGVGTKILEACEAAASAAGFRSFEMGATLTGAKLFGARGYAAIERVEVPVRDGLTMTIIHMAKKAAR